MLQEQIFKFAGYADAVVIWILVIMSIVSVGIMVERFFHLNKIFKSSQRIRHFLRGKIHNKEDLSFIEELAKNNQSVEGRGIDFALNYLEKNGVKGLEPAFTSFQLNEKPELEKSLGLLATIGSNAPFVGLLGTVLGIMKAFADLAQSGNADQSTVMSGISMALTATAIGLFVAIPCVAAFNFFQRRVNAILQNLESCKEICLAYGDAKKGK